MSERNAVQRAYDGWGNAAGFTKKSGSWYHVSDDVVSVSNLQKSQYGLRYYFNQAFWLRALGEERYPKDHKCHIRFRLESLLSDHEAARLEQLLNIDFILVEDDRIQELTNLLNDRLLPVIARGSTVAGLRTMKDERVFIALITGPAQQILAAALE